MGTTLTHNASQTPGKARPSLWPLICGLLLAIMLLAAGWFTVEAPERTLPKLAVGFAFSFGSIALLAVVEHFLPKSGPQKSLPSKLLHININLAYLVGFALITYALAAGLKPVVDRVGLVDLRFHTKGNPWSYVGVFLLTLFVGSFLTYWYHRLQHRSALLWAHHKLHHSDRNFDIWTSYRNNWFEGLSGFVLVGVPIAFLVEIDDQDPLEFGLFVLLILFVHRLAIDWQHLNLRRDWGWLNLVWTTPQLHRIHHSDQPEHFDKNFALPLWDMVFGTYYRPRKDEFPTTGVANEQEISSVWEAQIFTPREMIKLFKEHGWRALFKTVDLNPTANH